VKAFIAEKLAPAASERLRAAGWEVVERTGLQGAELAAALAGFDALLVRGATKVTGDVLRAAPGLRAVARAGTGLDNVDLAAAKELGVLVLNAPSANTISVAELTFALLLAFERHVAPASTDLRAGRWEKTKYAGREVCGKRLGLVGFGHIGRAVAMRARAFDMEVWASDPWLASWPQEFSWVRNVTLDVLLLGADYLSLHVPLTGDTRNLIGESAIARMKPGAVLINCARGGIVDEAALHAALVSGQLRGAALDVFAAEPPGETPLLALPNVIATPHLGASTSEAQDRAGVEVAERVIEALRSS
jgi:D-3-phosphoglycerate dehydrogenase / 2-oxoglutarate reductase